MKESPKRHQSGVRWCVCFVRKWKLGFLQRFCFFGKTQKIKEEICFLFYSVRHCISTRVCVWMNFHLENTFFGQLWNFTFFFVLLQIFSLLFGYQFKKKGKKIILSQRERHFHQYTSVCIHGTHTYTHRSSHTIHYIHSLTQTVESALTWKCVWL